jgi:hypothetical protein
LNTNLVVWFIWKENLVITVSPPSANNSTELISISNEISILAFVVSRGAKCLAAKSAWKFVLPDLVRSIKYLFCTLSNPIICSSPNLFDKIMERLFGPSIERLIIHGELKFFMLFEIIFLDKETLLITIGFDLYLPAL